MKNLILFAGLLFAAAVFTSCEKNDPCYDCTPSSNPHPHGQVIITTGGNNGGNNGGPGTTGNPGITNIAPALVVGRINTSNTVVDIDFDRIEETPAYSWTHITMAINAIFNSSFNPEVVDVTIADVYNDDPSIIGWRTEIMTYIEPYRPLGGSDSVAYRVVVLEETKPLLAKLGVDIYYVDPNGEKTTVFEASKYTAEKSAN